MRWGIRVTRPALMQLVQAFTRRGVPSTSARTRWTFGSHRRLFRLCENVTDLPNQGFFPQMSQTAAIDDRGYQGEGSEIGAGYAVIDSRWRCRSPCGIGPVYAKENVPSARKNTVTGWPNCPSDVLMASGTSNTLGNVISNSSMNALASVRESKMSTPRNCTRSPNSSCAATRRGISSRHGGHHDPQKLTTTGVPSSCPSSRWNESGSAEGSTSANVGNNGASAAFRAGIVPAGGSGAGSPPHEAASASPARKTRSRREVIRGW